jgi:hypothetical protein
MFNKLIVRVKQSKNKIELYATISLSVRCFVVLLTWLPLMKTPIPADDASSTPPRKRTKTRPAARRRTLENTYSDPAMRERLKNEIRAAAKGGEPGTWSARKSQLLTLAYQKAGGGYINRHPNSKQKELTGGAKQDWQTSDKKPARRATGTTHYLPKKA